MSKYYHQGLGGFKGGDSCHIPIHLTSLAAVEDNWTLENDDGLL